MNPLSAFAIYFIIWWVVLFMVLPFGVRNAHEACAELEEGHDAGAPVRPLLLKKALITTVISAILFGAFHYFLSNGMISIDMFPFIGTVPTPT